MKSLTLSLTVMVMLSSNIAVAQKQPNKAIQWTIAAELPAANGKAKALGVAGPVTGVHQNVLFVGGGANFPDSMPWLGGKKKYYDELYLYRKEANAIKLHSKSFKLPFQVAYAAVCSTPLGIVYAGGENEAGISNKVILVQWDAANEKVIIKDLPPLPVAVTNATATVNGNKLYIAGGETETTVSDQFYELDLNNLSLGWQQLVAVPKPVSHAVLLVRSNGSGSSIYLMGGRKKNASGVSDLYASVFEFDLSKSTWKEKKSLPYALSAGAGIATNDGYIWMLGGDKGKVFHQAETLIAATNKEEDEVKKAALIKKKNKLQATHPGFSKEVMHYNPATGKWKNAGLIPFDVPVTTTACMWGSEVIIPTGEISAGVRTPKILSGKFIPNGKGSKMGN